MSWDDIALRYGTDKASSHHNYVTHYERRLSGRDIKRVLEIGVAHGSSLRLWREVFPDALIVGLDIEPHCRLHQRIDIDVIIADASDPAKMAAVSALYGPFDLVIDDGSHDHDDIRMAFEELYPRMAPGGTYVIEDLPSDDPYAHEFAARWNGTVLLGHEPPPGCLIFVEHP